MLAHNAHPRHPLTWWRGERVDPLPSPAAWARALAHVTRPLTLVLHDGAPALASQDRALVRDPAPGDLPVLATAPAVHPEHMGSPAFCQALGLRLPYVAGAMANGIASPELVIAMGRAGMMGVYGAAGLTPRTIEDALDRIEAALLDRPWGSNLIHSPYEPALEEAVVDLYLRRRLRRVTASAFLGVTLSAVRYRTAGIHATPEGRIVAPNRLFAKISREEVAARFLAPPPADMLAELVRVGHLSPQQAELAARIPVAAGLIAEADSGGHTDNRPALALTPIMLALRDAAVARHGYADPVFVGAAGGIGTPHAAAAAFAMGADFILTGSINQACREAGTSDLVRQLLAESGQADVTMAPAADMFEMGVKLQVLRRGTLFAMRAQKLYDLYRAWPSLDAIPAQEREKLEKTILRATLDEVWAQTRAFWAERDPDQLQRAEADPKHRMALAFRWYLGLSSRWANRGVADRKADFQIWCGPAMGAFNAWARGSSLEDWRERRVVPVALNLLHGAAVLARVDALRRQGVALPPSHIDLSPRTLAELETLLA